MVKSKCWQLKEFMVAQWKVFSDFELEVEVHMPNEGYNSVGFRCTKSGKKISGYQCEVANERQDPFTRSEKVGS